MILKLAVGDEHEDEAECKEAVVEATGSNISQQAMTSSIQVIAAGSAAGGVCSSW